MRFTVFTPTFNRAYCLQKLYDSLLKQTFTDFEWLIIDDGSTDETSELIESFNKNNNPFEIVYKRKENGGKVRAINYGIKYARGELFYIVDSDDYLPENSLEIINNVERSIPADRKKEFCGVCGLKSYPDNSIVGTTYDWGRYLDITHLERDSRSMDGDKAEAYYTDVLIRYPFPEFDGEKFVMESIVWDRMAYDGYKIRYFNDIVYYCEYLEDGITKNSRNIKRKNPQGMAFLLKQSIEIGKYKSNEIITEYYKYYDLYKDVISLRKMAYYLHISTFKFSYYVLYVKIWKLKNKIFKNSK